MYQKFLLAVYDLIRDEYGEPDLDHPRTQAHPECLLPLKELRVSRVVPKDNSADDLGAILDDERYGSPIAQLLRPDNYFCFEVIRFNERIPVR